MPKRRNQIEMTDEEQDAFLREGHTLQVASIGPHGYPHLVAMWYGFHDGKPAFETFAKSQKVLNLKRDNRISVLVEDGGQYDELRGVEIVGTARVIDDPDVIMAIARNVVERYVERQDPADLDAVAAGMANKRSAIVIEPDRVVSWDHGKLASTY